MKKILTVDITDKGILKLSFEKSSISELYSNTDVFLKRVEKESGLAEALDKVFNILLEGDIKDKNFNVLNENDSSNKINSNKKTKKEIGEEELLKIKNLKKTMDESVKRSWTNG